MSSAGHFSRIVLSVTLAVGGGVLALMGACFGTGSLLDPAMELTTARELDAPAGAVLDLISTPEGTLRWWRHAGEQHGENRISERITVEPVEGGIDFLAGTAVFERWRLVETTANSATWSIDFRKEMTTTRELSVTERDGKTVLTWRESATIDSPFLRWMARLPQQNLEANFQSAMEIAESAANLPTEPVIEPEPMQPATVPGPSAPPPADD